MSRDVDRVARSADKMVSEKEKKKKNPRHGEKKNPEPPTFCFFQLKKKLNNILKKPIKKTWLLGHARLTSLESSGTF